MMRRFGRWWKRLGRKVKRAIYYLGAFVTIGGALVLTSQAYERVEPWGFYNRGTVRTFNLAQERNLARVISDSNERNLEHQLTGLQIEGNALRREHVKAKVELEKETDPKVRGLLVGTIEKMGAEIKQNEDLQGDVKIKLQRMRDGKL